MTGTKETWELLVFLIRFADKIADGAGAFEYAALLPDLAKAAGGIGQVPGELLDLDNAEAKELHAKGEELAKALELGNQVIYDDIEDGFDILVALKSVVLRHRRARAKAAEDAATKAREPR